MYKEIDTYELIKLIDKENINLIDIRDNYKFSQGTIANAKNIPINYLLVNPEMYLSKDDTYYLFCNYGSTSGRLCNILTNKGYNVINIRGGYVSYLEDSN